MPESIMDISHSSVIPTDAVSLPFADGAVVVRPHLPCLFLLNATGAMLWEGLAQCSVREAASELVATYSIPPERAASDIAACLADWEKQGLLTPASLEPSAPAPAPAYNPSASLTSSFQRSRSYRFLDQAFTIDYPDSTTEHFVHARLSNLQNAEVSAPVWQFSIVKDPNHYILLKDESVLTWATNPAALSYLFFHQLVSLIHADLKSLSTLHGATLSRDEEALLLIGRSGSGKSTLAAAMAHAGWRCHGDDHILLDAATGRCAATPACINLKRNSWPALQSRYPEIEKLPKLEVDDVAMCYLPMPAPSERLTPPPKRIFFPRYSVEAQSQLRSLGATETLQRLIQSEANVPMEPAHVARFLAWVEATPAWELNYGSLEEALAMIHSVTHSA